MSQLGFVKNETEETELNPVRAEALSHACDAWGENDGVPPVSEVVERAKAYYAFLTGKDQ